MLAHITTYVYVNKIQLNSWDYCIEARFSKIRRVIIE